MALILALFLADDRIVKAGETLTLTEDLVLGPADSLDVQGTAEKPCVVVGNGRAIRTVEKWTGRLRIVHTAIRGLGAPAVVEDEKMTREFPALDVRASGEAEVWIQGSTFTTAKGALAEHNVIRDGEWIVRMVEGEFRYNVVCDINDHDLLQNGSTGRIHHNVFVAGKPDHPPGSMFACIAVIYKPPAAGEGIEIWNNTFDAGGTMNVPGIEVNPEAFVKSLRNDAFVNFAHGERYIKGAQAMVRPSWQETIPTPTPDRLGYADYNLFHSPSAKVKRNYALSVAGKTERKDAGFGLNDVPKGGAPDAQADPKFKGPIPDRFPFLDEEIMDGRVTVSKMLSHFREIYTPAPGSPLIDAGDPADGPGVDIGAVGAGAPHPADRFGRLGGK